ncbi:MAG: mannose-1-phosphate guanylyltransferase [Chloroflexota bacterium]
MHIAILAGGIGTRLWPRSRQSRPKQFSDITGSGSTMIQETAQRVAGLIDETRLYVITGEAYGELASDQLPQIPAKQIITEPSGRDTAPAIGLACIHLHRRDPEAVCAILPADHAIADVPAFQAALARAEEAAKAGYLVTLGIEPTSPHTGYGYIKRQDLLWAGDGDSNGDSNRDSSGDSAEPSTLPVYTVAQFLEKPNRETAETFLADGGYYWNGGIFISRVDRMLAEMERQMPEAYACLQGIAAGFDTPDEVSVMLQEWARMPKISIDYGVMEGAERVAMVPLNAGWNDVGSWNALETIIETDEQDNCVAHNNVLSIDSRGNIIYSDKKIVTLIGVENLVVVDTGDALLISTKDQTQKVKQVVEELRTQNLDELL